LIEPDEPPNLRKVAGFPPYAEWSESQRESLRNFTAAAAARHGYSL